MSLIELLDLKVIGDDRGSLIALEENKTIPFPIKRIYYLCEAAEGVARGFHAHKILKQIAICVSGSCRFVMDDGIERESVTLDSPGKAIVIDPMIWHEMHDFSQGCVVLVLASEVYDETDYIRNYDEFVNAVEYNT